MDLSKLTLEQKVGQLFICGFHSLIPDDQIKDLISEFHVGGVVYFRRNIASVGQLAALSHSLQQVPRSTPDIPLFISIDQEGGMVSRLDHDGVSRIQGNMALGAANNLELTEGAAVLAAKEMLKLGINLNFAPCVDVNNNPMNPVIGVRSFGEDPVRVAEHGAAAIRGYQSEGVSATAKHFPGHGDTAVDSHLGLAIVPHDKERLNQLELLPFRKAIKEGVDVMMTAHVIFPAFEPEEIPATLSRRVLHDLLREEMGYEGVIITDCLEMHAISEHYGIANGAVRAIQAGADIVLVSHTMESQVQAIQAVREAVAQGILSEEQINESVQRVLDLKAKRLSIVDSKSEFIPVGSVLTPVEESESLLRDIAEHSVTMVSNSGNVPLERNKSVLVVWPELRHRTEVDEPPLHSYSLKDALEPYMDHVTLSVVGTHPEAAEIQAVLDQSTEFEQIIVVTYTSEGQIPDGQRRLVEALHREDGSRLIVVSTRNPYDIQGFPTIGTYFCLYENRVHSLDALAKVLAGKLKSKGILPVSLNSEYPVGHGL